MTTALTHRSLGSTELPIQLAATAANTGALRILVLANDMMSDASTVSALTAQGCAAVQASSIDEALTLLTTDTFTAIVVDIRPDLLGHQAVCKLRMAQIELPVLLVSARSAADAVQRARDVGADDVAVLPLDPMTLTARLTALVQRNGTAAQTQTVQVGRLEIDLVDHDARVGGRSIALAADEYRALRVLASHDGAPVRNSAICVRAGTSARGDDTVTRLRRKLARAGVGELIGNVRGVGFSLGGGCKVSRRRTVALKRAA
ncbi:MAG: response regulator transcription factor [Alphaproteobacteria bacterium]|nr:response regulator transcription factor [Alphaproteobacteria bacterium]